MGVSCVVSVPMEENRSGQHLVTQMQKKIEQIGAQKAGQFSVDCETLQSQFPINNAIRVIYNIHDTEYPASTFSIIENGPSIVSDNTLDLFFNKIDSVYVPRKGFKIETKGFRYELHDFLIKIGSVIIGQNTSVKGIILQIDYMPCLIYSESWGILQELFAMLGVTPNLTNFFKSRLDKKDCPVDLGDCAQQYLELFNNLRRSLIPISSPNVTMNTMMMQNQQRM